VPDGILCACSDEERVGCLRADFRVGRMQGNGQKVEEGTKIKRARRSGHAKAAHPDGAERGSVLLDLLP